MNNIYIFGAAGFGREVAWIIERINQQALAHSLEPVWNICGFIDDGIEPGTILNGIPVLGGTDDLLSLKEKSAVAVALGFPLVRKKVAQKLKQNENLYFPNLIDPSAIVSGWVEMGEGTIICANCTVSVNIVFHHFDIVNFQSFIGHDAVLEDFVSICASVDVSGHVHIGTGTEIGSGTQINPGCRVGSSSVIGAGSVVNRDIPCDVTAVGVPCRVIKNHTC